MLFGMITQWLGNIISRRPAGSHPAHRNDLTVKDHIRKAESIIGSLYPSFLDITMAKHWIVP